MIFSTPEIGVLTQLPTQPYLLICKGLFGFVLVCWCLSLATDTVRTQIFSDDFFSGRVTVKKCFFLVDSQYIVLLTVNPSLIYYYKYWEFAI